MAFTKRKIEEPAVWLADHHDHGSAYSVASYTKGELFLVELGYIVGEETLSKIMRKYYDEWSMKHPTGRDFYAYSAESFGNGSEMVLSLLDKHY